MNNAVVVSLNNNSFTASNDGIIIIRLGWDTSGSDGYYYVDDTTANNHVCSISTTDANGLAITCSFPVVGGHTYKVVEQSHVSGVSWQVNYFNY